MLTKPVAVVLVIAAVLIAAFVGGYVAQQGGVPGLKQAGGPIDDLVPVPDSPPAGGSASAAISPGPGGGGAAAAKGAGGAPARGTGSGEADIKAPRLRQGSDSPAASAAPTGGAAASVPAAAGGSSAPSSVRTGPPVFEELVVPAGEIIGLQLASPVSSDTSKMEDPVEAKLTEDVKVGAQIAIPAGTKLLGSVMLVDKGGKIKEPARIGVRFHTLALKNQPEIPLSIDPLIQEGTSPSGQSKVKIAGGAAAGAALGWMLGGAQGAMTGGAVGAGGGTAAQMVAKGSPAEVPKGAQARVKLVAPIAVLVEK